MTAYIYNFLDLFVESAPWLLLGFFIAGLIHAFISTEKMNKHMGGKGIGTTIKAAFIGAPLPLCSCGVVPAALGIRRSGASKNATVSFLVATPETGVDSISVTYALLGPLMAIVRPIAAIISAITAGILVGTEKDDAAAPVAASSCKKCCGSKKPAETQALTTSQKFLSGLRFSYIKMLDDISLWLLVGLLFAAAVQAFIPQTFFTQWGDSWQAFAVMALIGVPMYICATASTPIAAGFLFAGVSPGAVLVFMLAGPATNLGTIAIIRKELGTRALTAYLTGVVATSFVCGYLLNLWVSTSDFANQAMMRHEHGSSWFYSLSIVSAVVLALLLSASYYRNLSKKWANQSALAQKTQSAE
ncbi:Putative two-component membrane permease complex subunit SMU_747c [BD1-7 clade bacterium]|uniref:Two-component membrane permease complex subunit SMU_747c n=1 Tax=BD1-7 clade bacterium TaxID=2029982 RepID=A0A5S9QZC2_9GAMM|nr:Putative two-component membrane permease complex subunit SMU_747c [BD1-7 clade bacterium]